MFDAELQIFFNPASKTKAKAQKQASLQKRHNSNKFKVISDSPADKIMSSRSMKAATSILFVQTADCNEEKNVTACMEKLLKTPNLNETIRFFDSLKLDKFQAVTG